MSGQCPAGRDSTPTAPQCPIINESKANTQASSAKCPATQAAMQSKCPSNTTGDLDKDHLKWIENVNAVVASNPSALDSSRTVSSIPKHQGANWEYPSHSQFYAALLRKNKPAPPENINTMVDIHNFLNEACWDEIQRWENKYHCECQQRYLIKFQGKPNELSPLARFYSAVYGYVKCNFQVRKAV